MTKMGIHMSINAIKQVLIIGGGVAGIQAALDLAAQGIHVYLIEKEPSQQSGLHQWLEAAPTIVGFVQSINSTLVLPF